MNKNQWMNELYSYLNGMPENERNEIMMDYEEHFSNAYAQGKMDPEIIHSLGDPRSISSQYRIQYKLETATNSTNTRNIMSAVMATTALGFFNLIFVLGPFIGLIGVLIGLYATAGGIFISGIALIGSPLLALIAPQMIAGGIFLNSVGYTFLVFMGFGLVFLGALLIIGCVYLTKWFYKITLKYLKWNADIILSRRGK